MRLPPLHGARGKPGLMCWQTGLHAEIFPHELCPVMKQSCRGEALSECYKVCHSRQCLSYIQVGLQCLYAGCCEQWHWVISYDTRWTI